MPYRYRIPTLRVDPSEVAASASEVDGSRLVDIVVDPPLVEVDLALACPLSAQTVGALRLPNAVLPSPTILCLCPSHPQSQRSPHEIVRRFAARATDSRRCPPRTVQVVLSLE